MSTTQNPEILNLPSIMDSRNDAAAAAAAAAQAAAAAASASVSVSQVTQPQVPEQQMMPNPHLPGTAIDRTNSPHGSEGSHFSQSRPGAPLEALNGMGNGRPYGSPVPMQTQMQQQMPPQMQAPMQTSIPVTDPNMPQGMMIPTMPPMPPQAQAMAAAYAAPPKPEHQPPVKAYPCSTCGKGFARRSDLARHERIHSGIRPHVCDYPNCGKQFIQRSALTVHMRVHTGEKPHMCERCGKPFSDSSSLARHRRIHSGKRPYKCPYADCQKTFTRRTTLTRHQNHHTGTVEEAAAATAAALAAQASKNAARQARSDGGSASNHASPLNTPSPGQRNLTMSPVPDLVAANGMRQNEYSYMNNNGSLPAHLRTDMPPTSAPAYGTAMRPTSHPTSYPPPPTLEPNIEPQQGGPGSAGGSPHMGSVGWASPSHMPSPTHSNSGNGYVYPDPDQSFAQNGLGQMYYANAAQIRRPGSTEPGVNAFDTKQRPGAPDMWQTPAQ